jgi:hypothetical protein
MAALILYLATTLVIAWVWSSYVQRVSRAAAIVLILLPLLFTGRALLTGRVYSVTDMLFRDPPLSDYGADFGVTRMHNSYISDPFLQQIPWQKAVRYAVAHHEWPVWNPFMLCGDILAAGMQSAPYDPVNLLALLLPLDLSITFAAAITFFLAAFFTFAFAREIGCRELAALTGAAGYMLSEAMAFTVGFAPLARSWALFGFVLFAVRRVVRDPTLRSGAFLLIALTLLVFAGHPETMLHVVALGVVYGILELAVVRKHIIHTMAIAVAAGVVALLLTAIFLLPFLHAAPQSAEYWTRVRLFSHEPLVTRAGQVASRAGTTIFPFYGGSAWASNIAPNWDTGAGRVGSIIFALALAAFAVAPRRKETWFFLAAVVICLWAHFDAPPVAQILHRLPLFNVALNDRLSFAAVFFVSILAAFAIDGWSHRMWIAITCAAVALAIATAIVWKSQISVGVEPHFMSMMTATELVPLAIIAAMLFARVDVRIAGPVVLALLCMQRVAEDGGNYPSMPRRTFYPRVPVLDAMKRDRPFRVVGVGEVLLANTSALYELEDVRGYETMTFLRLVWTYPLWCIPRAVYFNRVDDLTRPFLSAMNVRYALAPRTLAPPEGWRVVLDDRQTRLLENMRVLPRVFAPRLIRFRNHDGTIVREMSQAKDFAETGWIFTNDLSPQEAANARATIVIRRRGTGYEIDATMDKNGWIVISDCAWDGWRVYIDGRRVRTHFANEAFLGIFVPEGRHAIRVVYLPGEFVKGRRISFGTLAALLIVYLIRGAGRSRPP